MKKLLLLAAAVAVSVVFAGCASTGTTQQTPAQVASLVCPQLEAGLALLQTDGVFTGGAANTLSTQIEPDVTAVCSAGANVTTTSLQTLVNATFPVILTAISNSSLSASEKSKDASIITLVQIALNVGLGIAAETATPAPAASAPVAASSAS